MSESCTESQLADINQHWKGSVCGRFSTARKRQIYEKTLNGLTDAGLAGTLREAILAATGCETKSVNLFFSFTCNVVIRYSNNAGHLPGYLAYMQSEYGYPVLTALLMDHFDVIFDSYIE